MHYIDESNSDDEEISPSQDEINRDYLKRLKYITKRNSSVIVDYYTSFKLKYPEGRINIDEFNDIVYKLIADDEVFPECHGKEENRSERIRICTRLFDVCDVDEDGKIDFMEVTFLLCIIISEY